MEDDQKLNGPLQKPKQKGYKMKKSIVEMIAEKSNTFSSITEADILNSIEKVTYTKLPSEKCLICEITLTNGFTVRGEAACVAPENFSMEIGKKVSYEDAVKKIWQLLGFTLQNFCPAPIFTGKCIRVILESANDEVATAYWNDPQSVEQDMMSGTLLDAFYVSSIHFDEGGTEQTDDADSKGE